MEPQLSEIIFYSVYDDNFQHRYEASDTYCNYVGSESKISNAVKQSNSIFAEFTFGNLSHSKEWFESKQSALFSSSQLLKIEFLCS